MSFTEKVDVLDLLVKLLNDHEKKLDKLVSRLERAIVEPSCPKCGGDLAYDEENEALLCYDYSSLIDEAEVGGYMR